MMKPKIPTIILIVLFIFLALLYIFRPLEERTFDLFTNFITVILPLTAGILGTYLVKRFGTRSIQGKALLFFSIACFTWTVAEILWIIYEEAVVSAADIFYLVSYPLWMISIIYGIKLSDPQIGTNKKKLISLIVIIIIAIVLYLKFIPLAWDPEITFLENILTGGYVIADLILLIPLIFLCYTLFSGKLSAGWIAIGIGVIALIVGDLWYAVNYEIYEEGIHLIDLAWYLTFIFFIYALTRFRDIADEIKKRLVELKEKNT